MLLVTTCLDATWKESDQKEIMFLGDWCLSKWNKESLDGLSYKIVPHHWHDRQKLEKDERYLKQVHEDMIKKLTLSLNEVHHLDYPESYWRHLLDPWLVSYVAVIWDRFECINGLRFQTSMITHEIINKSSIEPPNTYEDHIDLILSDMWNHLIFLDLIKLKKQSISIIKIPNQSNTKKKLQFHTRPFSSIKWRVFRLFDHFLDLLARNNEYIIAGSYFTPLSHFRLQLKLKQVPCLHLRNFDITKYRFDSSEYHLREEFEKIFSTSSSSNDDFLSFLAFRIVKDMPKYLLENYKNYKLCLREIKYKPKVIVTSGYIWGNELFKIWSAEKVMNGSKLILAQHGGSFPPKFSEMDFLETVGHDYITWGKPYKKNQTRLPSNKLSGVPIIGDLGRYCSLIGYENPRYVYRASAMPITSQSFRHFEMVCDLHSLIDGDLKANFKIKPFPNVGWNFSKLFKDRLGNDIVLTEPNIWEVFKKSKVIICTYPSTTFSESIVSGRPTLLYYPDDLWETVSGYDDSYKNILSTLSNAKILHNNPQDLATQLHSIWTDPESWWSSPEIEDVKQEFFEVVLLLDKDWCNIWAKYLMDSKNK